MVKLEAHRETLSRELEIILAKAKGGCLWPEPYNTYDAETAYRFLTECVWTFNEANQLVELIPEKQYIEDLVHEWFANRLAGKPTIVKKVRRMIISWIMAGLGVYAGGSAPGSFYIAAQKYPKSAGMVWRRSFVYDEIRKRYPEWRLSASQTWLYSGPRALQRLLLPNGSVYEPLTGENPDDFRQEGATEVLCEEMAFWPRLSESWSNAIIMCAGKPGDIGGHPIAVSTVSANPMWRELTANAA